MINTMRKTVIVVMGLMLSFTACSSFAEVAVVVNPSNSAAVDADIIKKLYLGKMKSFSDGTKVKLVFQQGDIGEEFTAKVLDRSSSQFKAYWAKRAFSGKGKPPKSLASSSEVMEKVSSTPGAIGIIDASEANNSVKIVLTR